MSCEGGVDTPKVDAVLSSATKSLLVALKRQTRTSGITPTTLVNDFNVEADKSSGFSVGPRMKENAMASKERPFSVERGIYLRQEVSTDMPLY
jgi:hypothetical protein